MRQWDVRTTVTLDEDVAAAIERLRRERSIGLSRAINDVLRMGLQVKPAKRRFSQRTYKLGARIDVTNVGKVLEMLDEGHLR